MLSKMLSPIAFEKYMVHENLRRKQSLENKKLDSSNSEMGEPAPKKSVASPGFNSNWAKFRNIVGQQDHEKEPIKRQHTQSSLPRKSNRRTRNPVVVKNYSQSEDDENTSEEKKLQKTKLTKQIAMDCEMVGIGDGTESMLARVSLVNRHGVCVYDKYVKPREKITDYRTPVSGIRPHHLAEGEDFKLVQTEVSAILKGRTLIGHALKHDLRVLYLSHPKRHLRDTSNYKPFKKVSSGNTPSLKKLAAELLGVNIQRGEHNSVEDARTAMQLYCLYKNQWESSIYSRK